MSMIIDIHAHLGFDYVFDYELNENDLLQANEKYGVDVAIVQPFIPRPYIEDHMEIHNRIYELCCKYPNKFYGMASINPHFRPDDYDRELMRCVKELGFVGVKITPIAHAANPASKDCMHVFEIADALGIPVMVHTGNGIPFADPVACIPAANAFPKVKLILAHAGGEMFFEQALMLARNYENVFLEPSWLGVLNTRTAVETLGAGKVMFSSDDPENIPVELVKYRTAIRNEKDLDMVLAGTATKVFNLKYQSFIT